jgi:predicted NUDIX family phosphoesterase
MNPVEVLQNIAELENLAKKILDLKKQANPRRPIVIEFCGSPKSGKSACINSLDLFLRRNNFRTRILTERASVCPVNYKFDPNFNIWTACSAIAELIEILSNFSKDYDIAILDRGIFDAICWFEWLAQEECLDRGNYESLLHFLTMNKWREVFDLVYIFVAKPEISLDREYANLLTRKTGSIMQPAILESYREAVELCKLKYGQLFRETHLIDTSDLGINEVNYKVTKHILTVLNSNVAEKIGYVQKSDIAIVANKLCRFSTLFKSNKPQIRFESRTKVETNDDIIQLIPIAVITDPLHDRILTAKKSKKATASNSPESEKLLLYFGGHVREEDAVCHKEQNVLDILKTALNRELKEEIGIHFYPLENDPFCIFTDETETSKKHLAICFLFEKNLDFVKFKFDKFEFQQISHPKDTNIIQISDLSESAAELEGWSRIIYKDIFHFQFGVEQLNFL